MSAVASPRRYALLDRDGTIIVDKVYLADPDGIEFAPGALQGMRLLRDAGFEMVLITNQSGIARGYFDEAALEAVHARLRVLLETEGLHLAAILHCPHGPGDGCACRKPAPGMVLDAMRKFGFGPADAVFIGDSDADMGAARAAGVRAVRIGGTEVGGVPDFLAAAQAALAEIPA